MSDADLIAKMHSFIQMLYDSSGPWQDSMPEPRTTVPDQVELLQGWIQLTAINARCLQDFSTPLRTLTESANGEFEWPQ